MGKKIRMGMVGGGEGAFIGAIHRMAAALDGDIELVAGCFSSSPERGLITGNKLGLSPERVYPSYQQMFLQESKRIASDRVEFIVVVTPNDLHLPVSIAALRAGFHVLSDKPAAATLEGAHELQKEVARTGQLYGLTHTYAAYPLAMQAREMLRRGELGRIRRVSVAYPQGWLALADDSSNSKQASWRTDPARSGESGCFADIGTHAHHLVEFFTGQRITEVCADLQSVVDERALDDDGAALFKLETGGRGTLTASQVCGGEGNNLNISIYGEQGSLFWEQESPNQLQIKRRGHPVAILRAGADCEYLDEKVRARCRTPQGHPEGYIEAFANIYRDFARMIHDRRENLPVDSNNSVGDIEAGVRAMAFVRGALESSRSQSSWVALTPYWE
ncbi:Gfo/Idh/MocA family oxidoreductase [Microbulbifer sp. OS29]|uniref:Gfo/Idh/MocA family oxidoreductase n=1 Tax=Microbulbifer okhotskensis TaxID=2926617 RepID=A0A9X2J7Y0_9GAMM|nr:Gfo/Idh/MocA family oxidoreductase [Microbulbifer okhotskensis]MCO1334981.1 Gfo/Idh/MocA family oxidoreductase [Microbulbifer okhotskensis]